MSAKPYLRERKDRYGQIVGLSQLSMHGLNKSPRVNGKLILQQNALASYDKTIVAAQSIRTTIKDNNTWAANRSSYELFSYIPPPFPGRYDEGVRDDAIRKAYAKLYDRVANVADIIRTRKETASMVYNTIRQLVLGARKLRRGDTKGAFHHFRGEPRPSRYKKGDAFGQRWLEYSYGWSPLIQDMYNILDKGFGDINFTVRASAKTLHSREISEIIDPTYGAYTVSGLGIWTSKATCRLEATIANSSLGAISSWGLDNPLILAWEAMPYSFVIDWFYPIGDYLDMACAFAGNGVKITSGSLTYNTKISQDWFTQPRPRSGYLCNATASSRNVSMKTRVLTVPAYPLPSLKNPFSPSQRILNQLSLLKLELSRRIV